MSAEHTLDTPIGELFETCPFGVMMIDRGGRICEVNPALSDFVGTPVSDLVGRLIEELPVVLAGALEPGAGIVRIELDQGERWLHCWTRSLSGRASTVSEVRYYTDVTDAMRLREEHDRLQDSIADMNLVDPVTGLPNHKGIWQALNMEVSRSRRYNNPLSVILLDIVVGDEAQPTDAALIEVSHLLKDQLRWADLVGRIDSGAFLLVLPETPLDAATRLTEKIANSVEQLPARDSNGHPLVISCVLGVAAWQKGDDSRKLVERAQQSLAAHGLPAASAG